jgi:hypothetical protein
MSQILQIAELLKELRYQLTIPKKNRPKDWDDLVGRLIGQISNDYANQENHELALTEISLINLAASLGSKHAKKRSLKPTLWLNYAAPSISKVLIGPDEQKFGIKSLSTIKSAWVSAYILRELETLTERSLIPVYLDWHYKLSGDLTNLLATLNKNDFSPKGISVNDWIIDLLGYLLQTAPKDKVPNEFISELLKTISNKSFENTFFDSLQMKVLELLNIISNQRPSILLAPTIPSLFAFFELGHQTQDKKLILLQELIAYKTLDLLRAGSILKSIDFDELIKLLFNSLKKSTYKFDRIQSSFISIEINGSSGKQNLESHDIETTLVALISNWQDYLNHNPSNKGLDQLSNRLNELLDFFSIVSIGEDGAIEAYDLFKHELIDEVSNKNITTVKVIRPGFGKQREDGSMRIFLKAIVESV